MPKPMRDRELYALLWQWAMGVRSVVTPLPARQARVTPLGKDVASMEKYIQGMGLSVQNYASHAYFFRGSFDDRCLVILDYPTRSQDSDGRFLSVEAEDLISGLEYGFGCSVAVAYAFFWPTVRDTPPPREEILACLPVLEHLIAQFREKTPLLILSDLFLAHGMRRNATLLTTFASKEKIRKHNTHPACTGLRPELLYTNRSLRPIFWERLRDWWHGLQPETTRDL